MKVINRVLFQETYRNYVLLFCIVLLGLVLRLFFVFGPASATDGVYYLKLVNDLLSGNLDLLNEKTYGFRYLMYFPIAASVLLFGFNDFAVILPGLLLSLTGIILIYKLTLLYQDSQRTALLAAFFMAIFPLEVVNATTITLDVPSSFFMSLSLYLFLLGLKEEQKAIGERKILPRYFLSGLALGISYQIRELAAMIVILYVLVFFWEIWKKNGKRKEIFIKFSTIGGGFLLILGFELFLTFIFTGYPLLRYYQGFGIGWGPSRTPSQPLSSASGRIQRITQLDRYLIWILTPDALLGFAFYLFAFSLFIIFTDRRNSTFKNREIFFTLFWIFFILFYLEFGTQNPYSWNLIEKNARFLTLVSIPIWSINAIGIRKFGDFYKTPDISSRINKRKLDCHMVTILMICIITVSSLIFISEREKILPDARPTKEVVKFLKELPLLPTYVYPENFKGNLEYYFNFEHPSLIVLFNETKVANISYVVITEEIYNYWAFPSAFESIAFSEWTLLTTIVKSRQSPIVGGFSYNYSTWIFYVD